MCKDFRTTLDAARKGDAAAFNSLFSRNMLPLMAFLRLKAGGVVGPRESVHDLAQSVCREVLMDMDDFEYCGENAFRKYLFLQAARKILDRRRYHQSAKRDPGREAMHPQATDKETDSLLACYATLATPSRHACAREELNRVEAALERLPESQREAVALSRLMDFTNKEIAAQLGTTESAVRGLLARGLARLSILLENDG